MASAENLKLDIADDGTTIVADGQIDSHTSRALDEALAAVAADGRLHLDLAEVSFIDSSGLRVIIRSHNRHHDHGGQLVVVQPSPAVTRLLEITGLTSQLQISPSATP